jgi:hypothetical protein
MAQLTARLVEHLAERHRNQFQMGSQGLEFSRWQGGEQMILVRTMRG